jgi:type II secretory pathway pseudopilin PulG
MDRPDAVLTGQRARGFTLLEAVVSTAILSVVLLGLSTFMLSQARIQIEEESATAAQTHLRRALTELAFELEESRPIRITTDGLEYGYCMPLKRPNGSLILDGPEAETPFGIPEKVTPDDWEAAAYEAKDAVKRNNHFTLAFRPRVIMDSGSHVRPPPQDPRQILDEYDADKDFSGDGDRDDLVEGFADAALGRDLNQDGDLADVYIYGNMEKARVDNGLVRWTGGTFAIPYGGKVFSLEAETVTPPYADPQQTQYGIYDRVSNAIEDTNVNLKWDASVLIMVWFLELREDAPRLNVSRTKVTLRNAL